MKYQRWIEEHKTLTPWGAWCEGVEAAVEIVQEYLKAYPADIFLPPPRGEHGKTVDACSAAALRAVLPNIIADIKRLTE